MRETGADPRSHRSQLWLLFALLLVSAILRAVVLWRYGGALAEDRDHYRALAEQIVAGHGFAGPRTHAPTAYRPPLYPLLLAALLASGGGTGLIGGLQLVLGVVTVGLTGSAGRRLGLHRTSLVAAALVAADPLLLYQTSLVMTEVTATCLASLFVWIAAGRVGVLRNLSLGIVFGLCCLCRPTFWACAVLAAAVWAVGRFRSGLTPSAMREAAALLAGAAVTLAPWAIRNALVFGRPLVTTTHGGYTLLLAHNPVYTRDVVEQPWGAVWSRDSLAAWQAGLEAEMEREDPPIDLAHLSPGVELARDRWMNRRAWRYIREQPGAALRTTATLLARFWNVTPHAAEGTPVSVAVRLAIGVFYAAVSLALLAGLWRLSRDEWRLWWPLGVLIVGFTLVHSLYWADMRMRTPLVPAIALWAAAGVRPARRKPM